MPEPTTPKGKKLPKWAIPVGIAVVIGGVIVLRKKKAATSSATEPGAQGLSNQSFIPVTGENVAGVGAANYGEQSSHNNEGFLREFLQSQKEEAGTRRAEEKAENQSARERETSFYEKIIINLGAGGGAPTGAAPGGVVVAPPQGGATPQPSPPVIAQPPAQPAPPKPACPGPKGFPYQGPHGCWHWSKEKTAQGCSCHGYENGTLECEHKAGGRCTF